MSWFVTGSAFAGTGVLLGAFAAHGLQTRLTPELLTVFETAVRYQMYHGLALLGVDWAATRWPGGLVRLAGWMFSLGTALFSGSLYLLTFTGTSWLGAITPFGGLLLVLGWALLVVVGLRAK